MKYFNIFKDKFLYKIIFYLKLIYFNIDKVSSSDIDNDNSNNFNIDDDNKNSNFNHYIKSNYLLKFFC